MFQIKANAGKAVDQKSGKLNYIICQKTGRGFGQFRRAKSLISKKRKKKKTHRKVRSLRVLLFSKGDPA